MTLHSDLPWSRINDYLLEVGSARDANEFGRRALSCLNDLVAYDGNGLFAVNDGTGRMRVFVSSIASKWIELYHNYYWKVQPPLPSSNTKIIDYRELRHTEYATDFISPQGIRYTAAIYNLKSVDNNPVGLIINRSKTSPGFSEQERMILEVIQPHLSNLYAIHTLLARSDIMQLPDAATIASDFKCLTKREAEIAALICHKFRTGMIATQLMISPMTVYRHVANIFTKLNVFDREELVERLLVNCSGTKER